MREAIKAFHGDQRGSAYTMTIVMLLPFYMLLIVIFVEIANLLNAQAALAHATHAAARAAAVHMTAEYFDEVNTGNLDSQINEAENEPLRYGKVHLAAVNSLAAFASGNENHQTISTSSFVHPQDAPQDWAAAHAKLGGDHDEEYLRRKWLYAAQATQIEIEPLGDEDDPTGKLRVTLRYESPFHTTGAGYLFGKRQSSFYTRMIEASVDIEKEGSKSENRRLPFRNYYALHEFKSENQAGSFPLPPFVNETGNGVLFPPGSGTSNDPLQDLPPINDMLSFDVVKYWVHGGGRKGPLHFGPNSIVSKFFSKGDGAKYFEDWFYKKFKGKPKPGDSANNFDYEFTPWRLLSTDNRAEKVVGSWQDGTAVVHDDHITFTIYNRMGTNSLFAFRLWEKYFGVKPMFKTDNDLHIYITWTVPLRRQTSP